MANVFLLYFSQLDIGIIIFRIRKKKISQNKIKVVKDLQGAKGGEAAVLQNLPLGLLSDLQGKRLERQVAVPTAFPTANFLPLSPLTTPLHRSQGNPAATAPPPFPTPTPGPRYPVSGRLLPGT